MVIRWCLIRITLSFGPHHRNLTCPSHGYHDAAKNITRPRFDSIIHNRGAHEKYIHMKCGYCKTMFIGCELIGKKAQPNEGAHKKYIHMTCGYCKTLLIGCEGDKKGGMWKRHSHEV